MFFFCFLGNEISGWMRKYKKNIHVSHIVLFQKPKHLQLVTEPGSPRGADSLPSESQRPLCIGCHLNAILNKIHMCTLSLDIIYSIMIKLILLKEKLCF